MLMTLFKWQAKILNKLYKTERYDKLVSLKLTNPEQIDYSVFFDITPGISKQERIKMIESANKLCRPLTRAKVMQDQVKYFNQFIKAISKQTDARNQGKNYENKVQNLVAAKEEQIKPSFNVQHVVVYSCLSKCRIWPKILKQGIGLVPSLIHFYNKFTKEYNDFLDFKFDPVILTQKYTKIMKKVNMRKKDHPKLIQAIKKNDIEEIKTIMSTLQQQAKSKRQPNSESKGKVQDKAQSAQNQIPQKSEQEQNVQAQIINNIIHKNLSVSHICIEHSNLQTIKYLASIGTNFQLMDDEQQTALFFAIKRRDLQIIKFLVQQQKVDVNHKEYQDRTAFYLAAFEGQLQTVDYLYKKGANPQMPSKLDRTPLSKACYLGNVDVVNYLLSINVDMTKQDNKGRTALHNAAWGIEGGRDGKRRGHVMLEDSPESVKLLLNAGHPVDLQDYDGFTALFSAVSSMGIRSMRLLIQRGANLHHITKNKETACFIAAKYGHLAVLRILIEQHQLNYTEPDYHGYSPLCASVTQQSPQVFIYLADLHAKNNIKLDISNIVQCCKQYDTVQNMEYVEKWMFDGGADNHKHTQISRADGINKQRLLHLANQLPDFVRALNKLKTEKRTIKEEMQATRRIRAQQSRLREERSKSRQPNAQVVVEGQSIRNQWPMPTNTNTNTDAKCQTAKQDMQQKQKQARYRIFDKIIQQKLQQQQQTQDKQEQSQISNTKKQGKNNEQTTLLVKVDRQRQLDTVRRLFDDVLSVTSQIIIQIEQFKVRHSMGVKQMVKYSQKQYNSLVIEVLSECIHLFNKFKSSRFENIIGTVVKLARIVMPVKTTIPPFYLWAQTDKAHEYEQSQQTHKQQHKSQETQQYEQVYKQIASANKINIEQFCRLKLTASQSQSDLIQLLTDNGITTNLTHNLHSITDTLFKLARYRKTGVIIAIFNSHRRLGAYTHDQLLDILSGKAQHKQQGWQQSQAAYVTQTTQNRQEHKQQIKNMKQLHKQQKSNSQPTPLKQQKMNLIQYCMLHGISDIAVYLQEMCKSPHVQSLVTIPAYLLKRTPLTQHQINVDLQAVDDWVFDMKQVVGRMGKKQYEVYKKFMLQQDATSEDYINHSQTNQQVQIKQKPVQAESPSIPKFQSCNNYYVIDTYQKIGRLQKILSQFVLIGLDTEHYNISKQQYFVCSIQISNGEGAYIIDTLSHLRKQTDQQSKLTPDMISNFMLKLMGDPKKIKIFHAYENDVRWLHQDFNLHPDIKSMKQSNQKIKESIYKNRNVIDTCKIYNLINKVKRGESVGLKTLCSKYLGHDMLKDFQRSDWRIRPLFKEMIQYAAIDAEVLPYIYLRMLGSISGTDYSQKLTDGFGKRNMKGRGIRNTLQPIDQSKKDMNIKSWTGQKNEGIQIGK